MYPSSSHHTSQMWSIRRVRPPTWWGYFLGGIAVAIAAAVYLARVHYDEFVMEQGLGLFFILVPLGFITIGILGVCVASMVYYAWATRGYILPLLLLLSGVSIAWTLPLPRADVEQEFLDHRYAYETVVQLAQQHQLPDNPRCLNGLVLPASYQYLTRSCIQAVTQPALAIIFNPPTTHRFILYAATPAALHELLSCCLDGSVYKQIDVHWYLFTPAQD